MPGDPPAIDNFPFIVSSPESENIDGNKLNELDTKISAGFYSEIHSLLIIRNGSLVFEKYYKGYSREIPHNIFSVTKSITSLLIGSALYEGKIKSIDEKILASFSDQVPILNLDDRKMAITIKNLLTMTSGIKWTEFNDSYSNPTSDLFGLSLAEDWIKFMLDKPMAAVPGTVFNYNSGNTILLSGIIKNAVGKETAIYGAEKLFQPLNILSYEWQTGSKNLTNTGWGLVMRPIDMAIIGDLMLGKGLYKGKRIISEEWINQSTAKIITIDSGSEYAMGWWRLGSNWSNRFSDNDIYYASGFAGQYILIIPHLNMIIVSTAGNFTTQNRFFDAFRDYILPSIKNLN
ncbi:hypothetical protein APF79_03050 [bacterium BRH_c32]|nr:MAG: hypothetical protein APF79_03050 [bacterium BRH_c32]